MCNSLPCHFNTAHILLHGEKFIEPLDPQQTCKSSAGRASSSMMIDSIFLNERWGSLQRKSQLLTFTKLQDQNSHKPLSHCRFHRSTEKIKDGKEVDGPEPHFITLVNLLSHSLKTSNNNKVSIQFIDDIIWLFLNRLSCSKLQIRIFKENIWFLRNLEQLATWRRRRTRQWWVARTLNVYWNSA